MTNYASEIVTMLSADSTLTSLLPGGIILIQEPGRKGLNRVKYQSGFNPQTGLIKPMAVVLELKETASNEVWTSVNGRTSTLIPELIWIYAQGDKDAAGLDPFTDVIEPAYNRIYTLLHTWRIPGGLQVLWRGDTQRDKHEPDLNDAAYYLAAFVVHGWRTFS